MFVSNLASHTTGPLPALTLATRTIRILQHSREVIETALLAREKAQPQSTAEVLRAAGRIRPLSEALRGRIIPGVTLDEIRSALSEAAGPSLSEIIDEQRGPRA